MTKNIDPDNPPEEVKKWIRRLKRCLKDHPNGIWLYSAGGLIVMAYKNGHRVLTKHGGMDNKYYIEDITPNDLEIDGGDW